jgi:hypothetical protein
MRTKETSTQTNEPAQKQKRRTRQRRRSVAPGRQEGTPEAKRIAAVVLEVLAGEITPTEAAAILGVSVMRYYVLESRALAGLVAACEARPVGHPADPERKAASLARELESQRQATSRYQALARAAHRALGIMPPKPDASKKDGKGTKRRRRKPTVRALKAAREFRRAGAVPKAEGDAPVPEPVRDESALVARAVP